MQKACKVFGFFIALVFFSLNALAAAPSEESLERVMKILQAEKLVNSALKDAEKMISNMLLQSADYQKLPAEQRKMMEAVNQKMLPIINEEMGWEKLKPMYLSIYRESFNQAELDSLIGLLESPVGQLYIEKLPLIQQKTMEQSQTQIQALMQRMQQVFKQVYKEAQPVK